jgi:hypothetical protein
MTNLLCRANFEIGIMSQLMSIIQTVESKIKLLDDIENIVISNTKNNPFDHIFVQNKLPDNYIVINIIPYNAHRDTIPSDKLLRYKTIKSKLILNNEITERFDKIKNELLIDKTFMGVHIRLTDMNAAHGKIYGYTYFDDFVQAINSTMETGEYTKIFIASDSQESVSKLRNIYHDAMVCCDDFIRVKDDYKDWTLFIKTNQPSNKKWIQDVFIEMLLLSECGGLVHRVSNFANVAKIYSNTIEKIFFLTGGTYRADQRYGEYIIYVEDGVVKARKNE